MGTVSVGVMTVHVVVVVREMVPRLGEGRHQALAAILPLDDHARLEGVGLGDLGGGFQVIPLLSEMEGLVSSVGARRRQRHRLGR